MIVGTSTGALIAFALVGGKAEDGKRQPMDCEQIKQMYKDLSPKIFSSYQFVRWGGQKFRNIKIPYFGKPFENVPPLRPYDSTQYLSSLNNTYGATTLSDYPRECFAGLFLH